VRLNQEERRQSSRLDANLEAHLDLSVLMREAEASTGGVRHMRACAGHTLNISPVGLALVLHAQNIDERFLVGGEGSMAIELDLPNGSSIEIQATPVRYEKLDEGYLIGARITAMRNLDRERLYEYLRDFEDT
jgi:hypothetical protein